jgi:hypothetical protein
MPAPAGSFLTLRSAFAIVRLRAEGLPPPIFVLMDAYEVLKAVIRRRWETQAQWQELSMLLRATPAPRTTLERSSRRSLM